MAVVNVLPALIALFFLGSSIFAANGLTDANIVSGLDQHTWSLLYFYLDTCGYCSRFNDHFDYLSLLFNRESNHDLQLVKVNGGENPRFSELFHVEKYPTLTLLNYETKQLIPYTKQRTCESIIDFIRENVGQVPDYDQIQLPVTNLHNDNFFDTIETSDNTLVVVVSSYMEDWDDYKMPWHFFQKLLKEVLFALAIVDLDDPVEHILQTYQISQFPAALYISGYRFKLYHPGSLSKTTLQQFIDNLAHTTPQFGQWHDKIEEFSPENDYKNDEDDDDDISDEDYDLMLDHIEL